MESLSLTKERTATRELEWTLLFYHAHRCDLFGSFLNFIVYNLGLDESLWMSDPYLGQRFF